MREAGKSADGAADRPRSSEGSTANGRTALDAVQRARERLSAFLGRPVDAVLGVERDEANLVITAQVVELSRIPNTTDVLADYEAVIDDSGEVMRFGRLRRYYRGAVGSEGR